MTAQFDLSAFSEKTISMDESTRDFRPWNRTIINWEIEYQGYNRGEDGPDGYIDFQVIVEIREAIIMARNPKTYKKFETPGYKLTVFQNMAFEGKELESHIVHDESFENRDLKKAFDAFQRELMNIQCWVEIAESRARIIPQANDLFECFHYGWVTDMWADDIICAGCGKRYWSERMWRKENGLPGKHVDPAPCL